MFINNVLADKIFKQNKTYSNFISKSNLSMNKDLSRK